MAKANVAPDSDVAVEGGAASAAAAAVGTADAVASEKASTEAADDTDDEMEAWTLGPDPEVAGTLDNRDMRSQQRQAARRRGHRRRAAAQAEEIADLQQQVDELRALRAQQLVEEARAQEERRPALLARLAARLRRR